MSIKNTRCKQTRRVETKQDGSTITTETTAEGITKELQDLCAGVFRSEARAETVGLITRLGDQGAEAVILGCTELPLIISPDESPLPLIDTTRIHAAAAVESALTP